MMPAKVAVLGPGEHARRNTLPALMACDDVELIGLCGREPQALQSLAEKYQCKVYTDAHEMLADSVPDTVYIALPVGLHQFRAQQVLEAGKHLWCEKSLTHDPLLTRQLVETARQRQLSLCECFMYTYHPQFQRLQALMQGDDIGTINTIRARFAFPHLPASNIRYSKALGGGALLDAGCYLLHAARQLSAAMPSAIEAQITQDSTYEVDTSGSARLIFAHGLSAELDWGFGQDYVNEIELHGARGKARAIRAFSKPADLAPLIELEDSQGKITVEEIICSNHFISMFGHFARARHNPHLRELLLEDANRQALLLQDVLKAADHRL